MLTAFGESGTHHQPAQEHLEPLQSPKGDLPLPGQQDGQPKVTAQGSITSRVSFLDFFFCSCKGAVPIACNRCSVPWGFTLTLDTEDGMGEMDIRQQEAAQSAHGTVSLMLCSNPRCLRCLKPLGGHVVGTYTVLCSWLCHPLHSHVSPLHPAGGCNLFLTT